jgi:hypothetical protein
MNMNHNIKIHKATGPAFAAGEVWVGSSGSKVTVLSVEKTPGSTGNHSSDFRVTYQQVDNSITTKDCYNFQVRYQHTADFVV